MKVLSAKRIFILKTFFMSRSLSIRMYLKHQKKDKDGKVLIYVHITIDGDEDQFSLGRKIFPDHWNQKEQKCTGKSQEVLQINAKINRIKGDLQSIFDRFPVHEVIRAKQLKLLYQGEDPDCGPAIRKDPDFHNKVLGLIDHIFV